MRSLRLRLLVVLLGATGFVWLCATVWVFFNTRAQIEKVLDSRLIEASHMVSSLVANYSIRATLRSDLETLEKTFPSLYNRKLSCQIWDLNGALIGRSESAPENAFTYNVEGFSDVEVEGETWRVFSYVNTENGFRVLVGDSRVVRQDLVYGMIWGLIIPGLLILPLFSFLLWICIRQGLRPLQQLAATLRKRPASELGALEPVRVSDELQPIFQALNGLFFRVAAARERERDFTAFAAHELKTPLAGLRTQAQIALASDRRDIQKNALDQIIKSVDRTARLIRQLIDLAHVEGNIGSEHSQDVSVQEVFQKVIEENAGIAAAKKRIILNLSDDASIFSIEPLFVFLAVRNLLENAVFHTPSDKRIFCSSEKTATHLLIIIEDQGAGISADDMPRIKDRFFRGSNKTDTGSGLGLAIAESALQHNKADLKLKIGIYGGVRAEMWFALPVV